jgi:hypothetical protein
MYRIKSSGEIKSQGELRKLFPTTSFPRIWDESVLDHIGVDPVFESPTPTTTRYQTAYKDGVEFKNNKWMWKWVVSEMDAETKATKDAEQAKSMRDQRNKLIAECDWTQVEDSPVDKESWAAYRQDLRDVPAQKGFPWNVAWPEMPE